MSRCRIFLLFYFFISFTYIIPAVVYTSGHCHHLSVECLALAPTGKSYPPLRQEMQEAFRPEHMRQEAECARVDFPCPSLEQDLRKGKMMTMTIYSPQRVFLYCSTGWQASATFTFCLAMTLKLSNFQKRGIAGFFLKEWLFGVNMLVEDRLKPGKVYENSLFNIASFVYLSIFFCKKCLYLHSKRYYLQGNHKPGNKKQFSSIHYGFFKQPSVLHL